jgi:hypothetical protein
VAPGGDDHNSGSQSSPLRSIEYAMSLLRAGDTLYVRGGSYRENVAPKLRAGTPSSRITVAAYPGERPVLVGLLWMTNADYWTIDGLNVTWSSSNGSGDHMVKFSGGTGWILRNAELWNAHSYAALLISDAAGAPSNWTVAGNCIHDTIASNGTKQDHDIYVNTGLSAGSGLITRNLIYNATNGRNIKLGGSSTAAGEGAANVTISYNTLYNAVESISLSGGTRNTLITRNILGKSSEQLINVYQLSGSNNIVRDNIGFAAKGFVDAGLTATDNRMLDPAFSGIGCGAFRPTASGAAGYGRYGN